MEWQPIDSAPKDAKVIVVAARCVESDPLTTMLAYWNQPRLWWYRVAAPEPTRIYPTHWMPLPAPPVPFVDDESRCSICGWSLVLKARDGCVRGNCSQRPFPDRFYAPERAAREYGRSVETLGGRHSFTAPSPAIVP